MAARESTGRSIGGAAMFAHGHGVLPHKIAPAATPHLAHMTGSGVAAAPIVLVVAASGGTGGTRREITLPSVLSGRQPPAALESPSAWTKVAMGSAMRIPGMKTETCSLADPTWQYRPVPTHASRRGRGPLTLFLVVITDQRSAQGTPAARESWPGAGRRRGRRRPVQEDSPGALPLSEATRRRSSALRQMGSPANALIQEKHRMGGPTIAWTERTKIPSQKQETAKSTFQDSKAAPLMMAHLAWNAGTRTATAYGWVPGAMTGPVKSALCLEQESEPTTGKSAKSTDSGKTNHVGVRVISDAKLATVGSVC